MNFTLRTKHFAHGPWGVCATLLFTLCGLTPSAFAQERAWYRGDLHNHSLYSDGDSSVADIMRNVETRGLDFFVLTDHDSYQDGVLRHWEDPAYTSSSVVLLYGVEWTTDKGHANVWATAPFDYAPLWQAHQAGDPAAAAAAARAQGALFSINHPVRPAALSWEYDVPAELDCVEIWNGPLLVNRSMAATYTFWDDLLLQGRRITGVGGSDTHHLIRWMAPFTGPGNPTTWVLAEERTPEAVLAALKAGHVTLSYTPSAPRLELLADAEGDGAYETVVGDNIMHSDNALRLQVRISAGLPGPVGSIAVPASLVAHLNSGRVTLGDLLWYYFAGIRLGWRNLHLVTIVQDGLLERAYLVTGSPQSLEFSSETLANQRSFYRAELYGRPDLAWFVRLVYGKRIAVTNPIYVNY